MKKTKKILSLVTIFLLITSLLVGCVSSTSKDTPGSQDQQAADTKKEDSAPAGPYDEHLDLIWIGHYAGYSPKEDTEIEQLIEEKFNVTIHPVKMDYTKDEQWNLYWASGNTADSITVYQINNRYERMISQGLIREITEEMLRENMPTWMKKVESMTDPEILKIKMYYDGKLYGAPSFTATQAIPWVTGIRKDWMENVGVTKAPETVDELHDLLVKFVKNDPDKNNKPDTYGMHGTNNGFGFILGAFGVQMEGFNIRDGKVKADFTTEEYKQALKMLQQWFKEGLIDPEFVTDNRDIMRKKWADSKFGVMFDNPWWFAQSTANNLTDMVLVNNPNAKIEFIPPVKGPDGKSGASIAYPKFDGNSVVFGKNTSDEKVKRIMAIKEEFCKDWDFYVRCFYGEEGKHYTKDKDGVIVPTAEYLNYEKQVESGLGSYFALIPVDMDHFRRITPLNDMPAYNVAFASPKIYTTNGFPFAGTNESLLVKGADIKKVREEFYFNAITGKIDIDAEWDSYINKLNAAGLKEVEDEYQVLHEKVIK
ncbi:MAG TPA: extracellular solute-binding protein [Clostridiaceae bacterium]|nr:extracellular solute-binding protein [Clostridiaceae bacterium]